MNIMPGSGTVSSPTRPPSDFLDHETECRDVLRPWLEGVLDMAESAGWNRRTAASTLMFLAAQHVSWAGLSSEENQRPTAGSQGREDNRTPRG